MKKVLTILVVLALVAGFAFATNGGNTVTLTTEINAIAPVFKLFINDGGSLVETKGVSSIAEGPISVDFVVNQNVVGGYSNFGTAVGIPAALTVTCGSFYNTSDNNVVSSVVPEISNELNGAVHAGALTYPAAADADGGASVIFTPTYHGKRVDNQTVGSFTATWGKDDTLQFGSYQADITLSYQAL